MLSLTYEITTALRHTDELISPPYDIAIVIISYGRVTKSPVWDTMMSKKNMGWPFYAAVVHNVLKWIVDVSVCRRFVLSTFWFVDVLVCRRFGLSTFRFVDVLVCRRFGLSMFRFVDVLVCRRFGLSTFWFVDVLVCRRFGLSTFRFFDVLVVDVSVCRHFDQLPPSAAHLEVVSALPQ